MNVITENGDKRIDEICVSDSVWTEDTVTVHIPNFDMNRSMYVGIIFLKNKKCKIVHI